MELTLERLCSLKWNLSFCCWLWLDWMFFQPCKVCLHLAQDISYIKIESFPLLGCLAQDFYTSKLGWRYLSRNPGTTKFLELKTTAASYTVYFGDAGGKKKQWRKRNLHKPLWIYEYWYHFDHACIRIIS